VGVHIAATLDQATDMTAAIYSVPALRDQSGSSGSVVIAPVVPLQAAETLGRK
jgi:hypothetical protein